MFKKLKRWFLCIFADIKIFKWPMWIVYDPVLYQLTGSQLRKILNTIEIGDIVARGYYHYADGFFIPGKYSHTGIYIGDGKIIHITSKGCEAIDILDFLQCDRCALIRLNRGNDNKGYIHKAVSLANMYVNKGVTYDFDFSSGDDYLYCHELTASCYPDQNVQKQIARMQGWLKWIKKKEPVYLASSFIDNPNFKVVYESE